MNRTPLSSLPGARFWLPVVAVVAALFACRAEVKLGGMPRPRVLLPPADPEPVLEDGAGGRWEYLLANTRRVGGGTRWDGTLHGPHTAWHDNGTKRQEGEYDHDRKEGAWTYWYPNGHKRWEGAYRDGRSEGREIAWHDNGSKYYEGDCRDGARHGWFTFWYPSGRKWFEGRYEAGLKEGFFRYWHEDGSVDSRRTGLYRGGVRASD